MAGDGRHRAPVAVYREQTVEIALGPKGAFENCNIGALTRRVSADWVVGALPPLQGNLKPPKVPRTPRVVELLRKAIEWRRQLDAGEVRNQAEIAKREEVTRARVTQIIGLLRLGPEIHEKILSLPDTAHRPPISERMLRSLETRTDNFDRIR